MSTTTEQEVGPRVPRDTLALRVKIARVERGLSQRAAANRCGLTFGEWQSIENGAEARGLDRKIDKIAAGLNYDRDWLMWGGPLVSDRLSRFFGRTPIAA
jgi:transcriptional regulator with XRE-family HTH domain